MERFITLLSICLFCMAPALAQVHQLTLYFETAQSTLTATQSQKLDSFIQQVSPLHPVQINITGFADSRGTEAYNQTLSTQRAQTIAARLQSLSIPMQVKGLGELPATHETDLQNSRKVNLQITTQPAPIASAVAPTHEVATTETPASNPQLTETLRAGTTIILKNLNFEGGRDVLLPQSYPAVKELFQVLQKNPKLTIEIGGHVCCFDDMPLSVARAKKIYHMLIENGIDASRLTYKGYSNTKLIANDLDETSRTLNRRVEIKILSTE